MIARRIIRRTVRADLAASLPASLNPVLRRVYAARPLADAGQLDLALEHLLPVSSLGNVQAAADLLLACHERGGAVLVVGDFDADGATSTALVMRQLRRLGFAQVDYLVPDRFRFGYGLTPGIVGLAAERRPSLIVTVDNGISSLDGVAEARRRGIDVLVTDHHLPGRQLPDAACIVNPNSPGEPFGSKALAGVGVAFYVMAYLTQRMRERGALPAGTTANAADLLDLVALGTIADVVPLDFNNRILVAQGLRRIRAGRCVPGLLALLQSAGRSPAAASAQDLAFQAGPRLNAAGRLEDMSQGIECLLTADTAEAQTLAARLGRLNAERRQLEARMQQEALQQIEDRLGHPGEDLPAGLCVFDGGWHQGVVGLVASRVKERLHRPVIALAPGDEGWLKGSARSIPGVHVRDVLDAIATRYPELLDRFGGHAMAAGLTIREDRLPEFTRAFAEEVERWVDADTLSGSLHTDGELRPGEFSLETAEALIAGGPWGSGFPEPCFDGRFGVSDARVVGERHLRLRLRAKSGETVDAIAFRYLDDAARPPVRAQDSVEAVFRASVDDYSGIRRLQLVADWLAPLGSD